MSLMSKTPEYVLEVTAPATVCMIFGQHELVAATDVSIETLKSAFGKDVIFVPPSKANAADLIFGSLWLTRKLEDTSISSLIAMVSALLQGYKPTAEVYLTLFINKDVYSEAISNISFLNLDLEWRKFVNERQIDVSVLWLPNREFDTKEITKLKDEHNRKVNGVFQFAVRQQIASASIRKIKPSILSLANIASQSALVRAYGLFGTYRDTPARPSEYSGELN